MSTRLYVSGSTAQHVDLPVRNVATLTELTEVFPFAAASTGETEGERMTREILSDPNALAEIRAAREEVARGDVVSGVDNVRALRPRK
jgi:hypothetical protein